MATSTTTRRPRIRRGEDIATVWLWHEAGRQAAAEYDLTYADQAWDWANLHRDANGILVHDWFNPVEIHIHPYDVDRAVAKWEAVAGETDVCHVEWYPREAWVTELNRVF